jgi:DNA-binding MarR family transcriptional regulator
MPPLPSEPEPLGRLLWRAHNWFRTGLISAMQAQDDSGAISPAQATLLSQLPLDGTSIADLARRVGVSSPTAHQWVHELVARDIVTVDASAGSARDKLVRLTETGRQRREQTMRMLAELETALGERIGAATVSALRAALEAPWGPPDGAIDGTADRPPQT